MISTFGWIIIIGILLFVVILQDLLDFSKGCYKQSIDKCTRCHSYECPYKTKKD